MIRIQSLFYVAKESNGSRCMLILIRKDEMAMTFKVKLHQRIFESLPVDTQYN